MKTSSPPKKSSSLRRTFAALALGALVGVFGHYLLYRFSLPSKPFIYVAF